MEEKCKCNVREKKKRKVRMLSKRVRRMNEGERRWGKRSVEEEGRAKLRRREKNEVRRKGEGRAK